MPSPLVKPAWLEARLEDPELRVVELRGQVLPPTEPPPHYLTDRAGYEAGHIPGAVFVDWQVDIVEPGSPSNDVASPERFAALMARLGISNHSPVVVYDNAASMFACRFRWCLRYYGHEDVRILDGGWNRWLAEGRTVSDALPNVEPGHFGPRANASLRATREEILAGMKHGGLQLLDTRSTAEFKGEASRAEYGGHIPGALSVPRSSLVGESQRLQPADELRATLTDLGVVLDASETVLYCNSGVSASYGLLALEVAGAANLRVYDGSWKEWGNDPATPKATVS